MLHYLFPPHKHNLPMFSLRLTKPPDSLSRFITFSNRSMRVCRNPMLSTSSDMINIGYRTGFRLEISFGYICRRSVSWVPIEISSHFSMGLTLSLRLWLTMLLSSILHPSLDCTQWSMWTSFGHIFHHCWTPQISQNR
jgi:hypothetical protein